MGPMEALDQLENRFGAPLIQIPGGLIRQEQHRLIYQCARDRHALLFPAGKLRGALPRATGKPHLAQPFLRRLKRSIQRLASNQQRHRHVLRRREIRQEMVPLPHKPYRPVSIFSQFCLAKSPQRISGEVYFTACWSVQRGQQMQKRALPCAGRPDDRNHLAAFDREVDPVERHNFLRTGVEGFAKACDAQHDGRGCGVSRGDFFYGNTRIGLPQIHCILYLILDAELGRRYVLILQRDSESGPGTSIQRISHFSPGTSHDFGPSG